MILNYNLMIHVERLRGKLIIKPNVTLELIQLIAGSKAFHSAITKTKFDIQEAISPHSFDEILI